MKKLLTVLLCAALSLSFLLSLHSPLVKAEPSVNLVKNPGFESALDDWKTQTGAQLDEMGDPHTGDLGCNVTGRTAAYSSPLQDLSEVINAWGPGDYSVSVFVKIDKASTVSTDTMLFVFNTTYDDQHKWITVKADINNKGFTEIKGTITIPYTQQLASCVMYLQSTNTTDFYDYDCDDFSVQKANGIKEPIALPTAQPVDTVAPANRPDQTIVGAIRWDAWNNPTIGATGAGTTLTVAAQVARNLSLTKYHFRAPYFSIVNSATSLTLPNYTQDLFDQEMLYAKEAGINYFAYCWYADSDVMSTARKLHTTSQYRDDVKMAAIWNVTNITAADLLVYLDVMKQSYYQKVADGRPLVYVSDGTKQTSLGIARFRQKCIDAGLKNPYLVSVLDYTLDQVIATGLDAYGHYALGGGVSGGKPYSSLMDFVQSQWKTDTSKDVQYVPCVATGWDPRPRIDNPVSWGSAYTDKTVYFQTASAPQIASLLQAALDFNKANPTKTNINSVLLYAWNEHDEGGWLCPTLIDDDGDGMPQLRADGTNARDTRRLQAIQQVLKPGSTWTLDKDIDVSDVFPTPAPAVTKAVPGATMVRDTAQPNTAAASASNKLLLYGGIGAGVIVIAAAVVTAFVLKGKGKKAGPTDDVGQSE